MFLSTSHLAISSNLLKQAPCLCDQWIANLITYAQPSWIRFPYNPTWLHLGQGSLILKSRIYRCSSSKGVAFFQCLKKSKLPQFYSKLLISNCLINYLSTLFSFNRTSYPIKNWISIIFLSPPHFLLRKLIP